ncbi:hypothetical protein GTO27_01390 [Candidatus Bathyarchaeota archaeon]|nr:hypothetical protein [Candidatus Bathyarchaeota archaeon]
MRSDYILYTLAILFFIMTAAVLAYQVEMKTLWTIATFVLGLLFIGLGYSQRPKVTTVETTTYSRPTPPAIQERKEETITVAPPISVPLTEVRGIGDKRSEQLKAAGIMSISDLADASAEDLATKLDISEKTTARWVRDARKLAEEA